MKVYQILVYDEKEAKALTDLLKAVIDGHIELDSVYKGRKSVAIFTKEEEPIPEEEAEESEGFLGLGP